MFGLFKDDTFSGNVEDPRDPECNKSINEIIPEAKQVSEEQQENKVFIEKTNFGQFRFQSFIDEFQCLQIIGKGSISVVSLLMNLKTKELFAGKFFSIDALEKADLMYLVDNEISTLSSCNHKNIIKYYKTITFTNDE